MRVNLNATVFVTCFLVSSIVYFANGRPHSCVDEMLMLAYERRYCDMHNRKEHYLNGLWTVEQSPLVHYMIAFESMHREYLRNKKSVKEKCETEYKDELDFPCSFYTSKVVRQMRKLVTDHMNGTPTDYTNTKHYYWCLRRLYKAWVTGADKYETTWRIEHCVNEFIIPTKAEIENIVSELMEQSNISHFECCATL